MRLPVGALGSDQKVADCAARDGDPVPLGRVVDVLLEHTEVVHVRVRGARMLGLGDVGTGLVRQREAGEDFPRNHRRGWGASEAALKILPGLDVDDGRDLRLGGDGGGSVGLGGLTERVLGVGLLGERLAVDRVIQRNDRVNGDGLRVGDLRLLDVGTNGLAAAAVALVVDGVVCRFGHRAAVALAEGEVVAVATSPVRQVVVVVELDLVAENAAVVAEVGGFGSILADGLVCGSAGLRTRRASPSGSEVVVSALLMVVLSVATTVEVLLAIAAAAVRFVECVADSGGIAPLTEFRGAFRLGWVPRLPPYCRGWLRRGWLERSGRSGSGRLRRLVVGGR